MTSHHAITIRTLDTGDAKAVARLAAELGYPTDAEAVVRFAVIGDSGGLPWWTNLQKGAVGYAIQHFDLLPAAHQ